MTNDRKSSRSIRVLALFMLLLSQQFQPVFAVQAVSKPTIPINLLLEQSEQCNPDPEHDLKGFLIWDNRASVINRSTNCTYAVGMASYRMFNTDIDQQLIFDWKSSLVQPGETITLEVNLPTCAYQIDFFYGSVLFSLDRQRYAERQLDTTNSRGLPFCQKENTNTSGIKKALIESITLDKSEICQGESVLVTVTPKSLPEPNTAVSIAINGMPGASQYLQFDGIPGQREIVAVATMADSSIDYKERHITVKACPNAPVYPKLVAYPNQFHPQTIDVEIANAAAFANQSPTYVWNLGDGQVLATHVPYISHSYASTLVRDQVFTEYQVMMTLQRAGQPDVAVTKTVSVFNSYAFNKQRGFIQPPVVAGQRLYRTNEQATGYPAITNLEDTPITLTRRYVEYQPCNAELPIIVGVSQDLQLEIAAHQESFQQIAVPLNQIKNMCGLAVHYIGHGTQQLPVYVNMYYDIPPSLSADTSAYRPVTDPAKVQLLNQLTQQGLVSNRWQISGEELYRLEREGRITTPLTSTVVPATKTDAQNSQLQIERTAASDVLGLECTPEDPLPRPGIICQSTGTWKELPARIANGYKGDAILSPGCGTIGTMLQRVSPSQLWSHSGMMIDNTTTLRHSTSDEDRYKEYRVDFEGTSLREDVLRWGWPGIITQSVAAAFDGEEWRDPESGKAYRIAGFSAGRADCTNAFPQVVKPPPGSDPAVRAKLHMAADIGKQTEGHYRFGVYTFADMAYDRAADSPAFMYWQTPHGQIYQPKIATVCSSFVWYALKAAGITLEGNQLEDSDLRLGAQRDAATSDGLYRYSETQRLAGALVLHEKIYNEAQSKAGWLAPIANLVGLLDNAANQVTNCFGFDRCGDTSNRWHHPGIGRAVSPADMMFWDSPAEGGVYGYNEDLAYRPQVLQQIGQWQVDPNVGTISGRVLLNGAPVPNAAVRIAGVELVTDQLGQFRDGLIPAGRSYLVNASIVRNGFLLDSSALVEITQGQITNIDLYLQASDSNLKRVARVTGTVFLEKWDAFGWNKKNGTWNIDEVVYLDPVNQTIGEVHHYRCLGDYSGHLKLRFTLLPNSSIRTTGEAWEEDSCAPSSRNRIEQFEAVEIAPSSSWIAGYQAWYELIGGHQVRIDFQVSNIRQPDIVAVSMNPSTGGTLNTRSQNGEGILLTMPSKAIEESITVQYTKRNTTLTHGATGQVILNQFSLDARTARDINITQFAQPYRLTIDYTDEQLETHGIDETSLQLAYWDGATWKTIPFCSSCGIDAEHNRMTIELDHFTDFALIGKGQYSVHIPVIRR